MRRERRHRAFADGLPVGDPRWLRVLTTIVLMGVYGGLLMPLVCSHVTSFPFVYPKALYFQVVVGATFPAWAVLALRIGGFVREPAPYFCRSLHGWGPWPWRRVSAPISWRSPVFISRANDGAFRAAALLRLVPNGLFDVANALAVASGCYRFTWGLPSFPVPSRSFRMKYPSLGGAAEIERGGRLTGLSR